MTRLLVLALLLLGVARTTLARTVDNTQEDLELENVETFGEVERKLDTLFDTFDDVIAEHTERVSNGETPNDDALNEKLFEVIEDAEDLDDDIADLVDNLDREDDESEFEDDEDREDIEKVINDDLDIMQSDATLLVSDAQHLADSVDTNPDGSRKAKIDPIIKAEMENVKVKAERVLKALNKSEKKVRRKRKRAGKPQNKSKVPDDDMEGAQSDVYNPYVPISDDPGAVPHRIYVAPDLANGKPVLPPRDNVIDVPSSSGSSPNDVPMPGDTQPDPRLDSAMDHGSSDPNSDGGPGDMMPDPRFAASSTDEDAKPVNEEPISDSPTSRFMPRINPVPNMDHGGTPDHADTNPALLDRLEARRLELEREEVRRRLEMTNEADRPTAPRSFHENMGTVSDSSSTSRRLYSPMDFDETFGRSNRQYFNVDGLENYMDECTDCVGMEQTTTCPLNSQVLELKKWANELQELLSFGCKKPETCTLPGICCVKDKYPFEQTVVQMTQMMKDVYNMMQDRCSRGCFGNPPQPLTEIIIWSPWGEWSSCDVTCGQGIRERRRTCPEEGNGRFCEGDGVELEMCSQQPCCVDGNWTPWSSWSMCSATCGQGIKEKTRSCTNPRPNYCGQSCDGQALERTFCVGPQECCIDGNWASWSRWSQCSVTCGQGVATRNRGCSDPVPNYCGQMCMGDRQETRPCGNAQECCVDGKWSMWNSWSTCSVSCGRGTRSRIRRCDSPSPNFCGMRCAGPAFDNIACDEGMCCVDGNWGSWDNWESCSTTCGRGNQLRRRRCDRPPPNSCGQSCPGNPVEARDCNEGSCCVDGNWGSWQRWSQCSATCGTGSMSRTRACDSPAPDWCGQKCPGLSVQRDSCDTGVACRVCVDGNWGSWNQWSTCSASCGQGTRERSRACDMPRGNFCGRDCFGSGQAVESCESAVRTVNGNWGSWNQWSTCSATCGQGTRERSRACDRPRPNVCGRDCFGSSQAMEPCESALRTVHGNWGAWTTWSSCSASCGRGQRERMRACDSPAKNACGRPCSGDPFQVEDCDEGPCIDCGDVRWNTWGSWSRCSATCGTGLRKRSRSCNNPYPRDCNDQNYCRGSRTDEEPCGSGLPCCDDVSWSMWSAWSSCSATCGNGVLERARRCLNARPGCEGSCQGPEMENQPCTSMECCNLVQWTSWSRWTSCSVSCGQGVQERIRDCNNPFPGLCSDDVCVGMDKSEKSCDSNVPCCVDGNWGSWSFWTRCSVTCGFGTIERRRQCNNPSKNHCGQDCPGRGFETDTCEQQPCITCVDGNWGMWESWSRCSVSCGGGSRERRRRCNNPPNNFCGKPCDGREFDTDTCNNVMCAPECVDGNWGMWGNWSPCPVTCGRSIVERYRSCDSPAPNFCGEFCRGDREESMSRLCGPLPVNGNWSPWTSWSVCSTSCGPGRKIRSRLCNSPAANACGEACLGSDEDIELCEERPCEECAMRDWTEWGRWGACSATCGFGMRSRTRYCEFLTLMELGQKDCGAKSYENCREGGIEEQACPGLPTCPSPSQWSSWGSCSVTCRGNVEGVRERVLMVMLPDGRFERDSSRIEKERCSVDSPECPTWGPWGPCSATCRGVGQRQRSQYIRTALGNLEADASQVQTETCQVDGPECPPAIEWGPWGPCSATCKGYGTRERRIVLRTNLGSLSADSNQVQTERCQVSVPECPSWGPWGPCSSTCRGEGVRERRFMIVTNLGSLVADTTRTETERCPLFGPECVNEAFWGPWEKWCPCDCRTGQRSRRRECLREDQRTGEVITVSLSLCDGQGRESKNCDVVGICPECITTCQGQPDGVYASCSGCADFIRCQGETGENNIMRCSKPNTQFDGFVDKCVTAPSPSCSLQDCVTDCRDQEDGDYHSCSNCSSFIRCDSGRYQEISCPDSRMEFNGHFDTCMGTKSPTCKRPRSIFRSATSTGIMVSDAPADEYYDETRGLNAEQRREMYEQTRTKTAAELREIAEEEERASELGDEDPFDIELATDLDEDVEEGGFFDRMKNFIAGATGTQIEVPDCVTSCGNLTGGRYPSCRGCGFYWRCFRTSGKERRCTNKRQWDNKIKRCLIISSTCPGT